VIVSPLLLWELTYGRPVGLIQNTKAKDKPFRY